MQNFADLRRRSRPLKVHKDVYNTTEYSTSCCQKLFWLFGIWSKLNLALFLNEMVVEYRKRSTLKLADHCCSYLDKVTFKISGKHSKSLSIIVVGAFAKVYHNFEIKRPTKNVYKNIDLAEIHKVNWQWITGRKVLQNYDFCCSYCNSFTKRQNFREKI